MISADARPHISSRGQHRSSLRTLRRRCRRLSVPSTSIPALSRLPSIGLLRWNTCSSPSKPDRPGKRTWNFDSRSGWADEARRHVKALDRAQQNVVSGAGREFVNQAARSTDNHLLDDAVGRFPQIARDWAEAELLSAWPQAALAGREAQAASSLSASRRVAAALARATGDEILKDAVWAVLNQRGAQKLPPLQRLIRRLARRWCDTRTTHASRRCGCSSVRSSPLKTQENPFALWTQLQFAIGAVFQLRPSTRVGHPEPDCARRQNVPTT